MRLSFFTVFFSLLAATVGARVRSITLQELERRSDLVVLGQVTQMVKSGYQRYAETRVLETWKGRHVQKVVFIASPTFACDVSDAVLHEKVLLFLVREKDDRGYALAHAGRGRMPIRNLKGELRASFWFDVRLDSSIATFPDPESGCDYIRSVRLDDLRRSLSQR